MYTDLTIISVQLAFQFFQLFPILGTTEEETTEEDEKLAEQRLKEMKNASMENR